MNPRSTASPASRPVVHAVSWPRVPMRWLRACLTCLAMLVGGTAPGLEAGSDRAVTISSAEFLLGDAPVPPAESAAWKDVALPDDWSVSRPGVSGYAWYRLRFDAPREPDRTVAVFIPWLRTAGAIYVNGKFVSQTGEIGSWHPSRPWMFSIPSALLNDSGNRLEVRLWVGGRGLFWPATVGDIRVVAPQFERHVFWRVTGPELICALSIALGLCMSMFWLQRRRETAFGYMALVAFSFAIFVAPFFSAPPLDTRYWLTLVDSAAMAVTTFTTFFALRHAGWHWPRIERALWAFVVATPLVVAPDNFGIESSLGWDLWRYVWYVVVSLQSVIFIASAWRRRGIDDILLAVASPWCQVFGMMMNRPGAPPWMPAADCYSFVPIYVAMAWILLRRFAHSLNEAEELNAQLEQRVAAKHAELQSNFARMQQLEREQAIAEERSRIMSDMHDGIGAQLISTLGMAEHGQLSAEEMASALRECLDDLRLTIDSLEPTDNDLLPVLGNFRYRVDPRLQRQGIALDWQVADIPKLACLTPRNLLHLLRILQEAFTNVLKHAHASLIRVETGTHADGQHVFIRVYDNGQGFSGEHRGHGLANMADRARRIGGLLQIEPSASGTTLELLLPVA